MLTIRQTQLEEFRLAKRRRFHLELLSLFRAELPNEVAKHDDATLLNEIATGHLKANQFGIKSERGVSRYIGLRLITSPPFDENPQIRLFLERSDLPPTEKMDLLLRTLINTLERQHGRAQQ